MNPVDLVLGGFVFIGAFQGFRKGLIREITAIVALFAGYIVARTFSPILIPVVNSYLNIPEEWHSWVAFFALFVLGVYLITLVGKFLTQLLKWVALGFLNRLAGAVFGAAKWILVLCLGLYFFERFNQWVILIHPDQLEGSILYALFQEIGGYLLDGFRQANIPESPYLEI